MENMMRMHKASRALRSALLFMFSGNPLQGLSAEGVKPGRQLAPAAAPEMRARNPWVMRL